MNDLVNLTIKIDRKRKELFSKLAQEEEIGLTQALKELMDEAIARGYINQTYFVSFFRFVDPLSFLSPFFLGLNRAITLPIYFSLISRYR